MLRSFTTAILLALVWLLWSGHLEPVILVFGAVSCLITVYFSGRLHVLDHGQPWGIVVKMVLYFPWIIWQIIVADLRVAKLILSPSMPIAPRLTRRKPSQKSELGQVVHANTITITPGTISLDLRDGWILVHALTEEDADSEAEAQVDRMISKLEGSVSAPPAPREER